MKTFTISIDRIGYGNKDIEVLANDEKEARVKAQVTMNSVNMTPTMWYRARPLEAKTGC